MRLRRSTSAVFSLVAFLLAAPSQAQDPWPEIPPAHLALVEGEATLLRGGERDVVSPGTPLVPGDVLRTDRGRANVLFPGGSALDLDEFSTVEFLSPSDLRLTEGRVILTTTGTSIPGEPSEFRIDTTGTSFITRTAGEYRLSVLPSRGGPQTELVVFHGEGLLSTARGQMPVSSSQRSVAFADGLPSYPQNFYSTRNDDFEEWSAMLRAERSGSRSNGYLPSDLQAYGSTFDRNGSWSYEPSYGNVWYPNVASGWGPYQDGFWDPLPAYGWTWVGAGAWTWPTHHYGRWGYRGSRWFWIPGQVWAPAWVAWGSAPGYVSWGPLGFNNQPVFGFSASVGYPMGGWTVVASNAFYRPSAGWYGRKVVGVAPPRGMTFAPHRSAPIDPPRVMPRGVSTIPAGRTRAGSPTIPPRATPDNRALTAAQDPGRQTSPRAGEFQRAEAPARTTTSGSSAQPRSRRDGMGGVRSVPAGPQAGSPAESAPQRGSSRAVQREGASAPRSSRWTTSVPSSAPAQTTPPLPPRPQSSNRPSRRVETAPPPAATPADGPQGEGRAYTRAAPPASPPAERPARAVPRSSADVRSDGAERGSSPARSSEGARGGRRAR